MKLYETHAILLRYHDYGESSRLFTFFTRDFGKVKLDARGARKSKKRHFTTIDLLTYLRVTFKGNEHKVIKPLDSIHDVEPFFSLRTDLKVMSVALYFTDIVSEFFKENEKNVKMFDELLFFLIKFDKGSFRLSDIPAFQLKVLEDAGLLPNLSSCIKCSAPFASRSKGKLGFNLKKGGFVCEMCNYKKHYIKASLGTLKMLQLLIETPLKNIERVKFTRQALEESNKILSEFIHYNLNKSLKSYEYLVNVKNFM